MKHISISTMSWRPKQIWLASIIILSFFSCRKSANLGFDDENATTHFVDTLSVDMSTVLVDSINSSELKNMLLGAYRDPSLGKVVASSFFQLRLSEDSVSFPADAVFDGASLVLYGSPTYYNEIGTTYQLKYRMHQLGESIDPLYEYKMFDTIAYSNVDLLQAEDRSKIDPVFAKSLFDAVNSSDVQGEFDDLIHGVALVPDAQITNAVLSYSLSNFLDTSFNFIELNYSFNEDSVAIDTVSNDTSVFNVPRKGIYRLLIDQGSDRFTNVVADRSGTSLSSIVENRDELQSEFQYVQACIGMRAKLSLPDAKAYFDQYDGRIFFNKVEVVLDIEESSYEVPTTIAIGLDNATQVLDFATIADNQYVFRDNNSLNQISNLVRKFQSMYDEGEWEDLLISASTNSDVERFVINHTSASPRIRFKIYFTELEK